MSRFAPKATDIRLRTARREGPLSDIDTWLRNALLAGSLNYLFLASSGGPEDRFSETLIQDLPETQGSPPKESQCKDLTH
jgi:hypothetical protein